jgi:hypothetical protein
MPPRESGLPDRERGPVSGGNGQRPGRLTAAEFGEVLEAAGESVAVVVDADGRPVEEAVLLPITAPKPASPATVKLPVASSAWIGEIRSEGEAVVAAVASEYARERVGLERHLAVALAVLVLLRVRVGAAVAHLDDLVSRREQLVVGLPGRVRRRLGQPVPRTARFTPWAVWGADTLMIANAYGLFGSVALPLPASSYVSNGVELVRAAAVSFGLTFGLKFVGGRLRDLAEELRERRPGYGALSDGLVVLAVVAGGGLLGLSAARLQAAFLALMVGGSAIHVPLSVLTSIVIFLGGVSFATGYFSAEPELAAVAALDREITSARSGLEELEEALAGQRGEVRALRGELRGVDERERLDLAEQQAHTERRVYVHVAGNVPLYGLELEAGAAKVPGAP